MALGSLSGTYAGALFQEAKVREPRAKPSGPVHLGGPGIPVFCGPSGRSRCPWREEADLGHDNGWFRRCPPRRLPPALPSPPPCPKRASLPALPLDLQGQKVVNDVEGDMSSIKQLLSITPPLDGFLKDPSTPSTLKAEVMKDVTSRLGLGKLSSNLISVLGESGRLGSLGAVAEDFIKAASGTRGASNALVTTFEPLTEAQLKTVSSILADVLGTQTVEIEAKTDASIMGGMIVEVGDKFLDLSTRTKLRNIENAIQSS